MEKGEEGDREKEIGKTEKLEEEEQERKRERGGKRRREKGNDRRGKRGTGEKMGEEETTWVGENEGEQIKRHFMLFFIISRARKNQNGSFVLAMLRTASALNFG